MADLSSASIFLILIPIITLLYFTTTRRRRRRATTAPSPQSHPIIGNLLGLLRNRHRFHDWVAGMLSATPHLTLQVNSHGICTANPDNLRHLLRHNFDNYVKGSRYHDVLTELLGDGIFNVDGQLWFSQRKVASHEFNTKSLRRFVSTTVEAHLFGFLMPVLANACENGEEIVDLQGVLRVFGFRNVCSIAFGVDVGEDEAGFMSAFDYAVEGSSDRFMSPVPWVWKLKRWLDVGSERKYREAVRVIDDFAFRVIRAKEREFEQNGGIRGEERGNEDLLSRFMFSSMDFGFRGEDDKRKFLRDIVISFILAGKDSTSTALTWFFWLISGHPHCERLIYNELVNMLSVGSLSSGFNYDDLKRCNYLHAALSESMRLFPPVPINSRLTVEEDILPDGTHVGNGWFADYSAYAMGRMERLWGPDCREYKPERWLDGNGVYQTPDPFKYPVFHCGPRMCLGKDMAYIQMKCVAAAIIYDFHVEAVDGGCSPEAMVNPPYSLSLLLKMRGGLPVRVKRRLQ